MCQAQIVQNGRKVFIKREKNALIGSIQSLFIKYPAMYHKKRETFIEEDTRYNNVHRTVMLQSPSSRHLGTSHSSPSRHQLPHRIFLNLINRLKSLPFQR